MTKNQFQIKHPDGLNIGIVAFKKSLHMVMTTGEIDKLIKMAKWRERAWLKAFKKAYLEVNDEWDFPFEPYLIGIKSLLLLKTTIALAIQMFEKNTYRGENESDE